MSVSDTSLTERRKIVKEKVLSRVCCFSTFVDVDWEVAERFWSGATLQCHWSRKKATSQKYDQQQCSWESSWDTKRFSNAWMFIVDSLSRIIFFSSRKKLWNLKYFLTSVSKERKEMKLSSFFSDAFLSIDWRVSFNNLLLLHPEIFSSVIHKVFSFLTLRFSEFRTLCSEENSDQMLIKS